MAREDYYEGGDWDEETETYYEGGTLKSSQIYTWGFGGTLVEVGIEGGDNDGCKVSYIYDNENDLIGRKVTLKTGEIQENERYLVDNQNPTGYSQRLAVVDMKNGHIRHEIFTDELAAETTVNSGTANTQFMHGDGLGSIRVLTGKSSQGENLGTSADRHFYDYTAFGSPLRGDRSLTNYAFTGQMYESVSGLQHHRARWLNINNGSWQSVDPEVDLLNYASSYMYVYLPLNFRDILGTSFSELAATAGISAAIAGLSSALIKVCTQIPALLRGDISGFDYAVEVGRAAVVSAVVTFVFTLLSLYSTMGIMAWRGVSLSYSALPLVTKIIGHFISGILGGLSAIVDYLMTTNWGGLTDKDEFTEWLHYLWATALVGFFIGCLGFSAQVGLVGNIGMVSKDIAKKASREIYVKFRNEKIKEFKECGMKLSGEFFEFMTEKAPESLAKDAVKYYSIKQWLVMFTHLSDETKTAILNAARIPAAQAVLVALMEWAE